jgi:hypothetical protein
MVMVFDWGGGRVRLVMEDSTEAGGTAAQPAAVNSNSVIERMSGWRRQRGPV